MLIAQTKHGLIEYRLAGSGTKLAIIFPGGHMNASVSLGDDYFIKHGYRVVTVSRPGYGQTPLSTGPSPAEFADAVADLLRQITTEPVVALGISAGGRSAVWLAAKYPRLVSKLILQCATSFATWPEGSTRLAARLAFNPISQKYTWQVMRWLMAKHPRVGLKVMLGSMTTHDPLKIIEGFSVEQSRLLRKMFSGLASDKGFMVDCKPPVAPKEVNPPTLIVHSKYDKSVSPSHAYNLHKIIPNSQLLVCDAESHLIWYSPHYDEIKMAMQTFLDDGPSLEASV